MSKPRSSFPADSTIPRGPWPWLLAAGPALVVVASLASAWLAISKSDPVVAEVKPPGASTSPDVHAS